MGIDLSIEDGVARIVINRPDRLNAIDSAANTRLDEILTSLDTARDVRCATITGVGRAFSAGADMKEDGPSGLEYWASTGEFGFGGIAMGNRLSVPLIARVNGLALGGGFEMVLGCDIIVAAHSATFGLPEPRVGRLPLDGMVTLPRRLPRAAAMGILLTGRRVTAQEALDWGLINQVVPDDGLDAAVESWVGDIVECAPLSLKAIKRTVNDTGHMTVSQARRYRSKALIAALGSRDADEGVLAFREKRRPVWSGS